MVNWEASSHSSHCPHPAHSTRSIMLFTSIRSWTLATLVYLSKLLCLKYVLPKHSPLSAQYSTTLLLLSFSYGTQLAPDMPSLILSPIHPFRSPRLEYLYPKSFLIFTISFTGDIPHHHTNFNPRKLEFNPEDSRSKTPKAYHCAAPHIVQQDNHPFPSSLHLLNTGNDVIYSTLWCLSIIYIYI